MVDPLVVDLEVVPLEVDLEADPLEVDLEADPLEVVPFEVDQLVVDLLEVD